MGGIEITAKNPPTDRRDCGGKRREGEITDTPEPREQEGIAFFGIAVMLITLVSWDNWTEREEEGSRGIASISVSSSFDTFYSFSRSMINDRCKWWNTLHYCFHYPRVVILLFLLFIFFSFIAINMAVSWVIFFSILNGARFHVRQEVGQRYELSSTIVSKMFERSATKHELLLCICMYI